MKTLPEIVKQEMLNRVQEEIHNAMADGHVIVDDWIPFDADWEINIWTSEGLTKASAYESDNGATNTGEWIDLFEGRLSWPTNLAKNVRLSRNEEGLGMNTVEQGTLMEAFALGYYHGRAKGESNWIGEAYNDDEYVWYVRGYEKGVADYCYEHHPEDYKQEA